jgi:hypothetical protein
MLMKGDLILSIPSKPDSLVFLLGSPTCHQMVPAILLEYLL